MASLERQFINEFKSVFPMARLEREDDRIGGNHHVTVRDLEDSSFFWDKLKTLGFVDTQPSDRFHSGTYEGGRRITYKDSDLYILVRIGADRKGNHTIVQKQVAPEKFGLGGTKWTNAQKFKEYIINNFPVMISRARDALISLLDVQDGSKSEFVNTDILLQDKSFITSDFGEILGAYHHLLQGDVVEFPKSSNQTNWDYYVNGKGTSHKSPAGSSRFVFKDYKDQINNLKWKIPAYRVVKAIANRDRYGILSAATGPEMSYWKTKLGGFSEKSFDAYIKLHTYDEFIEELKQNQPRKLGVHRKKAEAKDLWKQGGPEKRNPLMMSMLTLMARYYSESDTVEIGKVVCAVSPNNVFDYVDYDLVNNCVTMQRKQGYTKWRLHYHSNYGDAFNNWPAAVGVE